LIPRAFIEHAKVKHVILHTIEYFDREEQQAIGYFYLSDLSVNDISKMTELTENHILNAMGLYSERLEAKIKVFKKCIPYDAQDMLHVSDILFQQEA